MTAWNRAGVRAELIKVFQEHAQGSDAAPDVQVKESSHLVADLGIDSLGVMEVIADLEDAFKISIPDEALRNVDTIGDVASAIETKLKNEGRLEE